MKTKERIIGVREQSNDNVSISSLWYFNEDTVVDSSSIRERKSLKNDGVRMMSEKKDHLTSKPSERTFSKRDGLFVVDWQLSDNL